MSNSSSPLRSIRQIYYYVFRFAGFWFLILGSVMTFYIAYAMLTHKPDFSDSSAWWALLGAACFPLMGLVIIKSRPFKPK